MKLGLGLYRGVLNSENFRFARQAGATHIVAQLVDYIKGDNPSLTRNFLNGWGETRNQGKIWTYDELIRLKTEIESHGLTLEAIENFDPSHWYDVLLDGPKKEQQLEDLKTILRNVGKAGIPIMGYYFSLAGVWGWTSGPNGRGQANAVEFDQAKVDIHQSIPKGMVWNMRYEDEDYGSVPPVSRTEMWERLNYFLKALLPIAAENGVRLVAHPDDPPLPEMRGTARLFYNTKEYEKLLDISSSPANGFELCMGTIQEMQGSDVYSFLEKYASEKRIGYIHFRNVVGKVPQYREAFVDEGDIDMVKALQILNANGYDGVLIPDHTPEMSTNAGWHTGMAYALGFMKGAMKALNATS